MNKIGDFLKNVAEVLNPSNVDFNNSTDRTEFIVGWAITIAIFATLFAIFKYRKQINHFLRGTYQELKLVEWLNRKSTYKYTIITIFALVAGSLAIFALDQAFLLLRNLVILRVN